MAKPLPVRYQVITINEGGADFESFNSLSDLIRCEHPLEDDVIILLAKAELGDEIGLNNNSTCFVLKGE